MLGERWRYKAVLDAPNIFLSENNKQKYFLSSRNFDYWPVLNPCCISVHCVPQKSELTKLTSVFPWLLNVSIAQYHEIEFIYQNVPMFCILSQVFIFLSQLFLFLTNFQKIALLVKHPVCMYIVEPVIRS